MSTALSTPLFPVKMIRPPSTFPPGLTVDDPSVLPGIGLIGSEAVAYFCELGFRVIGIDNNMRQVFFGESGSTEWNRQLLERRFPQAYRHLNVDIRDQQAIENIFRKYGKSIELVIHTAAQPSHDWAAREPMTDFTVNANGTLNLLSAGKEVMNDTA